jgi:hypothetical protein
MSRLLRTLLSPRRQWAVLRALFELFRVEWALRHHPLQIICNNWKLQLLAGPNEPPVSPSRSVEPVHLPALDAWALAALARRWPWRGGCLRYALAVGRRLSPEVASSLILGVRRSPQGNLEAHAWLLHHGARHELPALPPSDPQHSAEALAARPFVPLQRVKIP